MDTGTPTIHKQRPRHVPTPRMSDRKKSLFSSNHQILSAVNESNDLGPMQPLDSSSDDSDGGCLKNERYRHRRLSFMKENQFPGMECLGQQLRRELVIPLKDIHNAPAMNGSSTFCPESDEHAQWGFQDENSMPSRPLQISVRDIRNDLSDISVDSNSLLREIRSSRGTKDSLGEIENVERIVEMKTPGDEWHRTQQKNCVPKAVGSFSKVFLNEDSVSAEEVSESDDEDGLGHKRKLETSDIQSPPAKKMSFSKARTSLTFDQLPEIPSNLFYSKSPEEAEQPPIKKVVGLSTKPVRPFSQRLPAAKPRPRKQHVQNRRIPGTINNGIRHRPIKKVVPQRRVQTREEILRSLDLTKFKKLRIADIDKLNAADDKKTHDKNVSRLREIYKNKSNPLTLVKPLHMSINYSSVVDRESLETDDLLADNESEGEIVPEPAKKFFKSGSNLNKNRFNLVNNLFASIDNGKLHMKPTRKRKRKLFNMTGFDEEDGEDQVSMVDPGEIGDILKTLDTTAVNEVETTPTQLPLPVPPRVEDVREEPSGVAEAAKEQSSDLFPIFYKDQQRSDAPQNDSNIFGGLRRPRKIRTIMSGADQYQIDAGQKAFGGRTCPECGLFYTQHEPEEEQLHEKFHKSFHLLTFRGWKGEAVVTEVLEWGVTGRIICVHAQDGHQKWARVQQILEMVDQDLGIYKQPPHERSMVYLAIAESKVIGVCVVQPLREAYRLLTDLGQDFCSLETFPVRCGISRIWVSPPYRNLGVATRLMNALRGHFVYGYYLSIDEIAFSAPTDDGKLFAERVTQRKDFFVYY